MLLELLGCVAELVVEHPPHRALCIVDKRQAVDAQDVAGVADRYLVARPADLRATEEAGAIGMVTTHDLALTEIGTAIGAVVRNVHFEDQVEQGKMKFDYRLREGVVTKSNAIELMRIVGLEV